MKWLIGSTPQDVDPNSGLSISAIIYVAVVAVAVFILQPGYVGGLVEYLGLTDVQAGFVASLEMAGLAVTTIILNFVSRRFDWRKLTTLFLALCAIGNLLSASVSDYESLLWLRFLTGLGSGGLMSLSFAMMSLTRRPDRNFGFIIIFVLVYGALGLWMMPTAFQMIGMSGVMVFFGLFCASGLLFVRFLPASGQQQSNAKPAAAYGYPIALIGISLLGVLAYNTSIGIVWTYLFLIGAQAEIAEQTVANVLFVSQIIGIAGALSASVLELKFGRTWPLFLGIMGIAVGIYCLVGEIALFHYVAGVCIFNLLWNYTMPYYLGTLADFDPTGKFVMMGISMQASGLALGPYLAASILEKSNYDMVYTVATGLFVASSFLLLPALRAQQARRIALAA
jgi:predicted MFS family arabinose efflux permease